MYVCVEFNHVLTTTRYTVFLHTGSNLLFITNDRLEWFEVHNLQTIQSRSQFLRIVKTKSSLSEAMLKCFVFCA